MSLPSSLHKGEAESIIGSIETDINFVVLDDRKASKRARSMGTRIIWVSRRKHFSSRVHPNGIPGDNP